MIPKREGEERRKDLMEKINKDQGDPATGSLYCRGLQDIPKNLILLHGNNIVVKW